MDTPAYNKLLELLDSAKLILASHAGNLSSADLRIRCLLNISADETRRALLEIRVGSRIRESNGSVRPALVENGARAHLSPSGSSG